MMSAHQITAATRPHLRGWFHAVACLAAITLAPILIVAAPPGSPRGVIGLYAGAIIGLFAVSAAYHRIHWSPAPRSIMKRLDHSMIFIAIAGSYTPIAAFALPSGSARLILWFVWSIAALGVLSKIVWPHAPSAITVIPYIGVGWAALLVIDEFWRSLGVAGFTLLLGGGLFYTVGALVYARRSPDPWPSWFGYHEVFHLLVIAGVASHYTAIAFVALPKA